MRLVPYALVRAPLLPARAFGDEGITSELFDEAVRFASPALHEHADTRAAESRARYRRRAAFRATPNGLLAGVAVVELGPASTLALGAPRARYDVPFARLASFAREHLAGAGWKTARLRSAPSLLQSGTRISWITNEADRRELVMEPWLESLLARTQRWTRATSLGVDRALLLQLVDDGLLHHDLEPPLVGPPPLAWLASRVPSLELETHDPIALRDRLATLPGVGPTPVSAMLLHDARGTVERAAIERAAGLAPLVLALKDALVPPTSESELAGLDLVMARASALVGEGLVPAAALDLGDYGARPGSPEPQHARLDVVMWLAGLVASAAGARTETLELDATLLRARVGEARCDTFELHLTPARSSSWLLGLHAPAGASWGRFAHALGAPMTRALASLRDLEREVDGDVLRVDVAYAPSRELSDLCCVPPLRDAALAVTSWPDEGALPLAACSIANDPLGPADRAIVAGDQRVRVSPLHRVRSTTAPPSAARALLADALRRQHAPWAITWGPLSTMPWLPRLVLGGFVLAPQSWAFDGDVAALRERGARLVQVGDEDVLLPLDLDRAEDRALLAELAPARVHEIWPPLGDELDAAGHRVELICAVVDEDAPLATPHLGAALPPSVEPPDDAWRTIRLYATRDRHDALFAHAVDFAERRADAYFVLPYEDERGEQLRVRLEGPVTSAYCKSLAPFLADGTLASFEIAPYQPERARYGKALAKVERVFQSDSRFVADALGSALDPELVTVLSFEALATGITREPDADAAFSAYAIEEAEIREHLAPAYRAMQRELSALLEAPPAFAREHTKRVRATRTPAFLLPTLLHLAAVRLGGPDRDREVRALYLWMRARRSRAARRA